MQFTNINKLNKNNVIFNEVVVNQRGNESIKIEVKNGGGNGIPGPLVLETPLLFSFGVQKSENKNGDLMGYSIPVCLWRTLNKPSEKEQEFYDTLKKIEELCYDHLNEVFESDIADMLRSIPFEREGKAPILFSKLIFSKKTKKICTLFHSRESEKEDPLKYLNQFCKVKMALIIESIYLGDESATVHIKVNDHFVKPLPPRQTLVSLSPDEEDEEDEEPQQKSGL